MKKLYFLLLAFSFFTTANAQIVDIPDANFKAKLLAANTTNSIANYSKIDANNDGKIQESEALNVSSLRLEYVHLITSLSGIEKFTNLKQLNCNFNKVTSLNLTGLNKLEELICSNNLLTNLDLTGLNNLVLLNYENNNLTNLNLTPLTKLEELNCGKNNLTTINLAGLNNLRTLTCSDNPLIDLDLTGLINLRGLDYENTSLTNLNLTQLINLEGLNCSKNNLTSLNLLGLNKLLGIKCSDNQLTNLNLSGFSDLVYLNCSNNKLTSLDLSPINFNSSNPTRLNFSFNLDCSNNSLTVLDLPVSNKLYECYLDCSNNQMTNLNLNAQTDLSVLNCSNNQLTSLDLNGFKNLSTLNFSNNFLTSLFIKNGKMNQFQDIGTLYQGFIFGGIGNRMDSDFLPIFRTVLIDLNIKFLNNPNLKYICADEADLEVIQDKVTSYGYTNCNVNAYCSFVPEGTFYTIKGNQKIDANKNGCDASDISIPNLKFTITDGTTVGTIISDSSGNYKIPVSAGTHIITPILENPTYFIVSPTTVNVTFPTQTSPFIQNFCITANGVRPDLEVTLLPLQPARPGFDAKYKLVYKNKGNTIQSGSVNLTFNDAVLDVVVANPVASSQFTNNLYWDFTNLQPFETREITITMNVNSPMEVPAVNNDDILAYTATITSLATDETPTDNTFTFNQTVVGSYDPNDKTCLQGSVITPALIGQYVHYTIRFENTGTFAAENVVVKDMIDLTKFDISTLVPTSASHSYTTRISEGNKVEFIFENINLPFDDANNDGYIAFKIKTKSTLVVNDSFTNEASIFFDYNFPIVTNKATSTFKTLGTQDFDFDRYFTVYPNPVKDILNISTKESINTQSMQVYNTLGQLVLVITNAEKTSNIDVSSLKTGNYFIQIKTDKGSSSSQFVKE